MTDIHFPEFITGLFALFAITDTAQILILLLSAILGLLLIMMVVIATLGRPPVPDSPTDQAAPDSLAPDDQAASEPVISTVPQTRPEPVSVAQQTGHTAASGTEHEQPEQLKDFQIFKRPRQKSVKTELPALSAGADEQPSTGESTGEQLRLIEKEMVRLRDLYQGGQITRDIYVDKTRSLYHRACGLSSVS